MTDAIAARQTALLSGRKFTEESILVKVTGPNQMNITIIDLPGIVQSGDGEQETRNMVEKYYKNERTLALCMMNANSTEGNNTFNKYLDQFDVTGSRTLKILAKCDNIEHQKKREIAARLKENGFPLHAVVCKPQGYAYNAQGEQTAFEDLEQFGLDASIRAQYCGIAPLKNRLEKIFAELLKEVLPTLSEEWQQMRHARQQVLSAIGKKATPPEIMVAQCTRQLQSHLRLKMKTEVSTFLGDFQSAILATKKQIKTAFEDTADADADADADGSDNGSADGGATTEKYYVYTHDKLEGNAFDAPMFQGSDAFAECLTEVVDCLWQPELQEFLRNTTTYVQLAAMIDEAVDFTQQPAGMKAALKLSWSKVVQGTAGGDDPKSPLFDVFEEKCMSDLHKEREFKTTKLVFQAAYLDQTQAEQKSFDDDLKASLRNTFLPHINGGAGRWEASMFDDVYAVAYKAVAEKHKSVLQTQSPLDQQKARVHAALLSYFDVASGNLNDNILERQRSFIIDPYRKWVINLSRDQDVLQAAREDAALTAKRSALLRDIHKMNTCLQALNKLT